MNNYKELIIITIFSVGLLFGYEIRFIESVLMTDNLRGKLFNHHIILIGFMMMMMMMMTLFYLYTWTRTGHSIVYNFIPRMREAVKASKLNLSVITEYTSVVKDSFLNRFKINFGKGDKMSDPIDSKGSKKKPQKINVHNNDDDVKGHIQKRDKTSQHNKLKNYAIILASGNDTRFRYSLPKQFAKIAGKTVLEHTIEIFENSDKIDDIIVVINPDYRDLAEFILLKNPYKKIRKLINGGITRKESSYIGIHSIEEEEAHVIIHDVARPFLTQEILNKCMEALTHYDAVDVAVPPVDTIIEVEDQWIKTIPQRYHLMRGQTPQCFKLSMIRKAHELSKEDPNFTDDCGLILKNNLGKVYVVEGDINNIKITYPSDLYLSDRLFQMKSVMPEEVSLDQLRNKVMVIFGGTSGIGKSTHDLAKKYGAEVYMTSKRLGCDITKYEMVEHFLKTIYEKRGRIDYVINSAGILKMGKLVERTIKDIEEEININYMGSIHVVKASLPYLKESKGSIQLYTSSSYTRGRAFYTTYSSSKAGIVNLVQGLAEELYDQGIRINAINPERTSTPMRFMAYGKEPEETLLKPEEVAEKSLKTLLTNLTGQIIDVRRNVKKM